MATKKRRKKKRSWISNHKFEAAVYVVGAIIVFAVIFGIVKLCTRGGKKDGSSAGTSLPTSAESINSVENGSSDNASEILSNVSDMSSDNGASDKTSDSSKAGSSYSPSPTQSGKSSGKTDGDYITYSKTGAAEADEWYLRVVSLSTRLPDGWSDSEITKVKNTNNGEYYRIDSRILPAYNDMVNAAKSDGIYLYPISGYRAQSDQERLFNNRIARAKNEDPSLSDEEAYAEAAKHVAIPRTSEHELGLAVDFNSVDETNFRNTKEAKWLAAHCAEYGFVIRYPEDKESVTGIVYEPWHVRFVGVKHAKRMNELGMCLEEYVAYIRDGGN